MNKKDFAMRKIHYVLPRERGGKEKTEPEKRSDRMFLLFDLADVHCARLVFVPTFSSRN